MTIDELRVGSLLVNKTSHKSVDTSEIWIVMSIDTQSLTITVRKVYSSRIARYMSMVVPLNVANNIFICVSK